MGFFGKYDVFMKSLCPEEQTVFVPCKGKDPCCFFFLFLFFSLYDILDLPGVCDFV